MDYIFFGYNGESFDTANPQTETITGRGFPMLFCGTNYRRTAENHDHVLAAPLDWSRFLDRENMILERDNGIGEDGIHAAFSEIIAAAGMDGLPEFVAVPLYNSVAYDLTLRIEEEVDIVSALSMYDVDTLYWIRRGMRHTLAVRLGFIGSLSDDDYQPLTITPEAFSAMPWVEVDHGPEEDE